MSKIIRRKSKEEQQLKKDKTLTETRVVINITYYIIM